MDFIKKIESGLGLVTKRSEELVEVTKLKFKKSSLEKQIEEKQLEIGRIIYLAYSQNTTGNEEVAAICNDIKELEKQIDEINKRIESSQPPEIKCPNCGAVSGIDASYCSKCGEKLLTCPNCGQTLAEDANFCQKCGELINDNAE
ncbi:MAG: hypothetical protein PWP31_1268 [Clostridia bacterium]|nr:hypothetical protein [Clostridia bacterium]